MVMDVDSFGEDFNKICEWLNGELGFDETPQFEVNEETISSLNEIMRSYETRKKEKKIIGDQMAQEAKEFIADKARMNKVLLSLDLDPQQGLSPKAKKYCSTLCASMEAVGVLRGSLVSIVVALTELLDSINKSSIKIEQLESSCKVLKAQCLNNQELASVLEKQLSSLESSLATEQKSIEAMQKATKFHSHKKKNYDAKIAECEKKLKKCGFFSHLSHFEIVKLGNKASELEKKLKPYLLQLESYKELPADLNLARIKLHEVMNELKEVEDELHQVFQNMSFNK